MYKKLMSCILAVLMLCAVLAGCGSSSTNDKAASTAAVAAADSTQKSDSSAETQDPKQKSGTFTVYTYYADSGKMQIDKTVEMMKQLYPNVTLNVEHRADSDGAVLKTRAAVGELPDIFECTGTLTDTFIKSKDILPLNDVMEKNKYQDVFMDGLFKGMESSDGNFYAVQAGGPAVALFYYNKKVFADNGLTPPKNYPEFLQLVKTIKSKNIIPLALFAQQKWPGLQIYDLAVVSQEPAGLAGLENNVKKITDKAYVDAANKVYELVQVGLIGKGAFNTNASQAFELMKVGKAAMLFNGSWYFGDCKDYGDNVGYFEYNPFADPGKEEDAKWNASGGANTPGGYAVSAKGKDPEFAKQILFDFTVCKAKVGTQELANVNTLKEDVRPNQPRAESFETFASNLPKYKSFTKFEWSLATPEMITVLEDSTERLYTGTYKPDNFISDVQKSLAEIIK